MQTLVIDDHHLFAYGFVLTLSEILPELAVTTVISCEDAMKFPSDAFKIVLMDMNMPGLSGVAAIREIRRYFSLSTIVVLSGESDPILMRSAIEAGASGFIPKSSSPSVLHAALELVFSGGIYIPRALLSLEPSKSQTVRNKFSVGFAAMTHRQREVFDLLLKGVSNKAIANQLNMSEGTVKSHLSTVYRIIDVSNRTEAVILAAQESYSPSYGFKG